MPQRGALTATLMSAGILLLSSCGHRVDRPGGPSSKDKAGAETWGVAQSVFGPANVNNSAGLCSGRIALTQGTATVHDACFTGDTNVVLCTDATAANPIKCAPSAGALAIAGTGSDVISYVRAR